MQHEHRWSPAALGAAALTIPLWSTSYVGTRVALHGYSPMALALLRFLVASSALMLYGWRRGVRLPRRRDVPLFVGAGFLGIFLYMGCFNVGHQTVPAATGAFLIAVTPIFTAVNAAIAHKSKLGLRAWLGMFTSLVGVAFIALAERPASGLNLGVFLILFAAWLLSLYNVMVKPLSARYSPLAITLYTFCAGTLFMLVFTPTLVRELPRASLYATLVAVGLGIFPAAMGYALWSYALARAPAAKVASFMYVTPVLTMLLGWAWLGEWPHTLSLVGGAVALSGVVLTNLRLDSALARVLLPRSCPRARGDTSPMSLSHESGPEKDEGQEIPAPWDLAMSQHRQAKLPRQPAAPTVRLRRALPSVPLQPESRHLLRKVQRTHERRIKALSTWD